MNEFLTGKELLEVADGIATEAHAGAKYGGLPYIHHPREVARLARELGYPPEVEAACLLHDVPEDTDKSVDDLLSLSIPLVVVEAVESVTWRDQNTDGKIDKARAHMLGHVVKYCDSSKNLQTTVRDTALNGYERSVQWTNKYTGYLQLLLPGLPTPAQTNEFITNSRQK